MRIPAKSWTNACYRLTYASLGGASNSPVAIFAQAEIQNEQKGMLELERRQEHLLVTMSEPFGGIEKSGMKF